MRQLGQHKTSPGRNKKSGYDANTMSHETRRKRMNNFENDLTKLMAEVHQWKESRKDPGDTKELEKKVTVRRAR